MKVIVKSINNLASAINNLAASFKNTTPSIVKKATTSNPISYSQKVKYYPSPYSENYSTVTISKQEYDAYKAVYKAFTNYTTFTNSVSYPNTSSKPSSTLANEWPALSRALLNLVYAHDKANKLNGTTSEKDIWKAK